MKHEMGEHPDSNASSPVRHPRRRPRMTSWPHRGSRDLWPLPRPTGRRMRTDTRSGTSVRRVVAGAGGTAPSPLLPLPLPIVLLAVGIAATGAAAFTVPGRCPGRGLHRRPCLHPDGGPVAFLSTHGNRYRSSTMAMAHTIWLRHETKAYEERVTLTPDGCKKLLDAGFKVAVEKSPTRIIPDVEYEGIDGVEMKSSNACRDLPYDQNMLIVGLKELGTPEEHTFPIVNKHTYFAHAYKGQEGWESVLRAYERGETGVLYDYEFLWTPEEHNIGAAMSPFAGFVGCAQGIRAWCWQKLHEETPLPPITPSTKAAIAEELRGMVEEVKSELGLAAPRVMVIGALGRCGSGSRECAKLCGLETIDWDMEETKAGGPFPEILKADILVNCILFRGEMPPFLTSELVDAHPERALRVIADVSCDPNSEFNPIPLYDRITSWQEPALRIRDEPPLDVISVDNLPSVLAAEASEAFGDLLLPLLLDFPGSSCWEDSAKIFREKKALLGEK